MEVIIKGRFIGRLKHARKTVNILTWKVLKLQIGIANVSSIFILGIFILSGAAQGRSGRVKG